MTTPTPIIPFRQEPPADSVSFVPSVEITEDTVSERDERQREAAFDAVFRWRGEPLLPFTSSRKSLWLQMRVAMGAPRLASCLADHHAFIPDAARILFLCSFAPDAPPRPELREGWGTLRADPAALQAEIDRWHDTNICGLDEEIAAVDVAMNLYTAAYANRHEPAPVATTGSDLVGN